MLGSVFVLEDLLKLQNITLYGNVFLKLAVNYPLKFTL